MKKLLNGKMGAWFVALAAIGLLAGLACTKEVVKEVPVETVVEKEVVREVVVEKPVIVEKEVIVEVEVEKPVEVVKEVVVEREVVKEVEVQVVVEKEVVKPVIVEVPKEVIKEVEVEVPVSAPSGEVTWLVSGLAAVSGWTSKTGGFAYHTTLLNVNETLLHGGKDTFGNQLYLPKVFESWDFNASAGYTDFKVKQGNYFHKGWGEVTAEDVVYTSNEGDPRCASAEVQALANPVRHSGLPDPDYGCWELIDKYTVRQPWTIGHPGVRGMFEITDDAYPWGVYSKKAYDEMGWEWMRDNVIGSGPYEWEVLDPDVRYTMIARQDPENEDEKIPYILRFHQRLIPEVATLMALFEAEQGDISNDAEGDELIRLLRLPYVKPIPNGGKLDSTWNWMGNYWETVHPISGEPLTRVHRTEYPWICAPGPDPLKPEESDCNAVAKKFRKALYTAMPRQMLLDTFYGGLGSTIKSPIANSDDYIIRKYGDRWGDPYDPEKAKALFAEWKTDYAAAGNDPDAVTIVAWGTGGRAEQSEGLLTHWAELFDIDWEIDNTHQSAWAPGAWGGREGFELVLDSSPTYRGIQMRWDSESWWTARSAPLGTNHGYEALMNSQTIAAKNEAWDDPAELERLTVVNRDWHYDQAIMTGAVESIHNAIYNSNRIASWPVRGWWMIWDPQYMTLVSHDDE